MTPLLVHAIDHARLDHVRRNGTDGHGNRLAPFAAAGRNEPLRCCLRNAEAGEQITLISYAPFDHASVWTEVGPVYIHADRCGGYAPTGRLPAQLATGPRVLRTYRADDSMSYDHNTVVADRRGLEPVVAQLLREPDVNTVHVRTLAPQCFLYAVSSPATASPGPSRGSLASGPAHWRRGAADDPEHASPAGDDVDGPGRR